MSDAGPVRLFLHFDAPPAGTDLEGVGGPGASTYAHWIGKVLAGGSGDEASRHLP